MPRIAPPESCNVYTPPRLADAIVSALKSKQDCRWLEPCVGQGAFLEALNKQGIARDQIVGIDLALKVAKADNLATVKRGTEFLAWSGATQVRFERIVANPPFISLSKLPKGIQNAACAHQTPDGKSVTLASNCWYAFFCACLKLLRPGGSIAFVLPSSFEYADYAKSLREQLPNLFSQFEVHRSELPLFESVGEGSVVVIGYDYRAAPLTSFRRKYPSFDELLQGITVKAHGIKIKSADRRILPKNLTPLKEIMSIGIGAVTGDADYFLLTEIERIQLALPISAVTKVVSKSKQVQSAGVYLRDWKKMRDLGERVWLFRPTGEALQVQTVKHYLKRSQVDGGCNREAYKIRRRSPWYLTPLPAIPHGFLSGMSQSGPVICFNHTRLLTATNTLYTVRFKPNIPPRERFGWALMLLTTQVDQQLSKLRREYALGLNKYEPGDLESLLLPIPCKLVDLEPFYRDAVSARLQGDRVESSRIADNCMEIHQHAPV